MNLPDTLSNNRAVKLLLAIGYFCQALYREFIANSCQKSAAALTYMTLFALVPLMTVTYTMFSLIPAFDGVAEELQGLIVQHFLPETSNEVSQYLADFSAQARSLTKAGIVILLVTAYLMLRNIERTFNAIWGVQQGRSGLAAYLLYWAILSVGPLLLGAGFVVSTYVLSLKLVLSELSHIGFTSSLFQIVPWFMTCAAFTLLFVAVPNCRVPFRYGLVGGIITALCFEALKTLFGYLVANSNFKLIYGAFAVVPLFLLWINMLWTIILAGAVFVRTLAELSYATRSARYSDMRAVLVCMSLLRAKSRTGETVSDKDCVAEGIGLVHWQRLRSLLVRHKWIVVTDSGDYALSRNLSEVSLWQLASLVRLSLDEFTAEPEAAAPPWMAEFVRRQQRVASQAKEVFAISLEDLLASVQKGSEVEHEAEHKVKVDPD
nr:YihY family inner membrane protein [Teredinibacter waterburyi]